MKFTKYVNMNRIFLVVVAVLALSGTGWQPAVNPARIPQKPAVIPWPTIHFEPVISGLNSPVHITHASDGSGRLFIVEQPGYIRIFKNGSLQATPFLDIHTRVLYQTGGERGLLSVAFPPQYSQKKYFYVYYTNLNGDITISRFFLSSNPDVANSNNESIILVIPHPIYPNHNGGQLAFGPDGYLYIGTGDGGGGGDPNHNSQNPNVLLGKILRIDVEPEPPVINGVFVLRLPFLSSNASGSPTIRTYSIPASNPYVNTPGYRAEIWALGLRNPWRFSFDRQNGNLIIGDVGQNEREEIDFQPANSSGGVNYGWNIMEGSACYGATTCDQTGLTLPVFEYTHPAQGCASVTGGFVYRGASQASLQGIYYLADYCSGQIWGLQPNGANWLSQPLLLTGYNISSFGEDEAGEIYIADLNGSVYHLVGNP